MFKEKLAKLINVKTIITILLTFVFCFLCITQAIGAELFMTVFTTVIGFYFGNQASDTKTEIVVEKSK